MNLGANLGAALKMNGLWVDFTRHPNSISKQWTISFAVDSA
jgi:hypothetical protein